MSEQPPRKIGGPPPMPEAFLRADAERAAQPQPPPKRYASPHPSDNIVAPRHRPPLKRAPTIPTNSILEARFRMLKEAAQHEANEMLELLVRLAKDESVRPRERIQAAAKVLELAAAEPGRVDVRKLRDELDLLSDEDLDAEVRELRALVIDATPTPTKGAGKK